MTLRKLASVLAVALIALGNLTFCPDGNCPMMQEAKGDCCAKGDGLKSLDCCPSATERNAPRLSATRIAERLAAAPLLSGPSTAFVPPLPLPSRQARTSWIPRGPAPPGSLLDRHTSLLL